MTAQDYYSGDEFAGVTWQSKYGQEGESSPEDMHMRMAKEFARVRYNKDQSKTITEWTSYFFGIFDRFQKNIPQGRVMAGLGVEDSYRSLSNCLRLPPPNDSYSSIMKVDTMLVSSAKRGCGYGVGMSKLRPKGAKTRNSSKTSTGVIPFGQRYSNSTGEVGQEGRRGACLEDLDIRHPDATDWGTVKRDKTKLTGANISFKLRSDFIDALKNDEDYILRFPVDMEFPITFNSVGRSAEIEFNLNPDFDLHYNELHSVTLKDGSTGYFKKVRAKELWDAAIHTVWSDGCPGLQFWDRIINYDPSSVYSQYQIDGTNACFHPDTLIDTVNGKVRIADINEETYVYSMDENERLCIRRASPSFISRVNTKTLKITLNCGTTIQVTPDHKLYVHDKGWVEAKDLQLKDRVAHISRSKRGHKYVGIKLSTQDNRDYVMEHRLVYEGVNGVTEYDVHHSDNDSFNNHLYNLQALPHDVHARITATNHNPQDHQVRNDMGRFVSTDIAIRRTCRDIDETVVPNLVNQYSNRISSIEEGETIDVYDIQVEGTHCLIANNIVAHNCGEQPMAIFDTCRLLTMMLLACVVDPFTEGAYIDFDAVYEYAYIQMEIGDDLIDLEIEHIQRILAKIESDPEPEIDKAIERELWSNVLDMAVSGRRVGGGITALADMLAAVGVKYDSAEALVLVENVMKTKMIAELEASIDLAKKYGPFIGWDGDKEFMLYTDGGISGKNDFYQMLAEEFPELAKEMYIHGRRFINWSTIAPVGTTSAITIGINYPNVSSGCEPQFGLWFFRNKKVETDNDPYDFIDEVGIKWKQYPIMMGAFKDWIEINSKQLFGVDHAVNFELLDDSMLKRLYEQSPWFGCLAQDIDWKKRVEMQAILQKYTTSAISSTINLPSDVKEEVISEIYLYAYEKGLKGITCYRDKSKGGVLVNEKYVNPELLDHYVPIERPKELDGELHVVTKKGQKYGIAVGLMKGKPYEVFAFELGNDNTFNSMYTGKIIRVKSGVYKFQSEIFSIDNMTQMTEHHDEAVLTRWASMLLQHGAKIETVMEQTEKSKALVNSYPSVLMRILKKYVKDGEVVGGELCETCNIPLVFEEGCKKCKSCGNSKC